MNKNLLKICMLITFSAILISCSEPGRKFDSLLNHPPYVINSIPNSVAIVFQATAQVKSITDNLYSKSTDTPTQLSDPNNTDTDTQSCDLRDTATVTIYSTNGMAQSTIDVKLDGLPIGSLTTYYPSDTPACKATNARGIITINVKEGTHTIEATSPNLNWPRQRFSVNKCSCMLLPLS